MDFLIDSITRKNTRISFFYLTVYFNRNRFNGLPLFVRCCTVCNADMFAFLKLHQLTDISCIRCFDTIFDIDDATRHSLFTGLAYRFADRDNTVRSIRLQDIPLRHLATIAESRRIGDTTGHACIKAQSHILSVSGGCMHTDGNTGVASTCAFTDGQCIILCFSFSTDSY